MSSPSPETVDQVVVTFRDPTHAPQRINQNPNDLAKWTNDAKTLVVTSSWYEGGTLAYNWPADVVFSLHVDFGVEL